MDLTEFVQTTIEQIMRGASNAQAAAEELGGTVNPKLAMSSRQTAAKVQEVEFDVSVVAREGSGSDAKLQVGLPWLSAGVGGDSERSHAAENRVRSPCSCSPPRMAAGAILT